MEQIVKPQIIVFDGIDKVGKSTLKVMLDKATNFNHWVIDRGPLSHISYNIIYNRQGQNSLVNTITDVCANAILVYVTASVDTINARVTETCHEQIDILRDKATFDAILAATGYLWKGIITVDTSTDTEQESFQKILKGLANMLNKNEVTK